MGTMSRTAAKGFPVYAAEHYWVASRDVRTLSVAVCRRRDAVCAALGWSEDEYERRAGAFEAEVRRRHPLAVSRLGCWARDVLSGYSSKVAFERARGVEVVAIVAPVPANDVREAA